jgi:hypothetical protein
MEDLESNLSRAGGIWKDMKTVFIRSCDFVKYDYGPGSQKKAG